MAELLKKLGTVSGLGTRVNDVLFLPATCQPSNKGVVVFFPGDVQNYEEDMKGSREFVRYIGWSFENTAHLLAKKYGADKYDILIVRAGAFSPGCHAQYTNFMACDPLGSPMPEYQSFDALEHLEALLKNAYEKMGFKSPETISSHPITLVGFSKGCMVLNQLFYEISALHQNNSSSTSSLETPFISRLQSWYWLDSGNSNTKNAWISDPDIVKSFADFVRSTTNNIPTLRLRIAVSPYQANDVHRFWIRQEMDAFRGLLMVNRLSYGYRLFFPTEKPSLARHFCLLDAFEPFMTAINDSLPNTAVPITVNNGSTAPVPKMDPISE